MDADKLIEKPVQTGLLLEAVGVAGVGLTTTVVVPARLTQPFTVAFTLYVPALAQIQLEFLRCPE